ncbi:MAG TPA: formylglycine-generating enzyme family protein [Rhizomicrobium sp.]
MQRYRTVEPSAGRACMLSIRKILVRAGLWCAAALALAVLFAGPQVARAAQSHGGGDYVIRFDHWTDEDERVYGEFVQAIGDSGCTTVDACLKGAWNPFHASDPPTEHFYSDCAQFPYVLRAYFAWKRGLPFSYESGVRVRGGGADPRYSPDGNTVTARTDVLSGSISGYALLTVLQRAISTASYRMHPDIDSPLAPDFYSAALGAKSIRPGSVIYDPNGHAAIVTRVESDGRIQFMDAHPDNTITHEYYDLRFARSRPGQGAGFKDWRPARLVDYRTGPDGALLGGHIALAPNGEIPDFSDEQYYGNGQRPDDDNWPDGTFALNGENLDYYDYVRAKVGGGKLEFDPVKETAEMVDSNCNDLHYRAQAVDIAIAAGIQNRAEPERLPRNIYGTSGDWETYSSPSRDARLKTAFKELRDKAERFVTMYQRGDSKHLIYAGSDIVGDMLAAYDAHAGTCSVSYTRSNGAPVALSYEDARQRLFRISFDPYQCIELRWGASDPGELSSCRDGDLKRAWYDGEQNLRNQIDRTYDARMDFSLADLRTPGPGKGVPQPPDTDARAWLVSMQGRVAQQAPMMAQNMAQNPGGVPGADSVAQTPQPPDIGAWRAARQSQFAAWRQQGCSQLVAEASGPVELESPSGSSCTGRPTAPAPRALGEIWDAPDAPEMMVLPAGSFAMGSPAGEPGRTRDEGPQHAVQIPRPFAVSKGPITFDEWDACAADGGCKGYTPGDAHWGRGKHPVVNVNWRDVQAYVAWLSAKTGQRYRLPSEAEWEYAARAGTETPFWFGDTISTGQANYDPVDFSTSFSGSGKYLGYPTPVDTFAANPYGLLDMTGNVWEWTQDCWNESYAGANLPTHGEAWLSGDCNRRVVRAGAFNNTPAYARSAARFWEVGDLRSALVGFRVAREM